MCSNTIYQILANDDPTEYTLSGSPLKPIKSYSSSGGSCTVTESGGSMTISNCDCSDPKNYNFADEGRFKI